MDLLPFVRGSRSALAKLNELKDFYNCFKNIRGDGLIKVNKAAGGVTISLDVNQARARIVSHEQKLFRAYCKTDAPADTVITCYLHTDGTGTEIEVNCVISGGGNLDRAEPHLTDGLEIPVFYDEGKWKYAGNFQHREPC